MPDYAEQIREWVRRIQKNAEEGYAKMVKAFPELDLPADAPFSLKTSGTKKTADALLVLTEACDEALSCTDDCRLAHEKALEEVVRLLHA